MIKVILLPWPVISIKTCDGYLVEILDPQVLTEWLMLITIENNQLSQGI